MQVLFSLTLFLSAALVFWVQPMFGKRILPLLGGTPGVWNTCLVFFQASLLLGYLYAHAQQRYLSLHKQVLTHLILLSIGLIALPIGVPQGWIPPVTDNPVPWLLILLVTALGLPCTLLSATAPLLQSWFSRSLDRDAGDPYFLYVASNIGSLVGLLGYPFAIEANVSLVKQALAWSGGYILLLVLVAVGGLLLFHRGLRPPLHAENDSPAPSSALRLRWLLLAAVPSSLLQSVTSHVTLDLASVPLLWVLPLTVYLVSFILVFARRQWIPHDLMVGIHVAVLTLLVILVFFVGTRHVLVALPLNIAVLFSTAMVLHGELVRLRPSAGHLTEFYLWLALGGVVGGFLCGIVAPMVFSSLAEYPLSLILAAIMTPAVKTGKDRFSWRPADLATPLVLVLLTGCGVWAAQTWGDAPVGSIYRAAVIVPAGFAVWWFSVRRRVQLGILITALVVTGVLLPLTGGQTINQQRNFFGLLKVVKDEPRGLTVLLHGTTIHGSQFMYPEAFREPTSYFYRGGPVGDVFSCLHEDPRGLRVGVAGLGTGTMSCYARPQDTWYFYEIDPAVARVARDEGYFTYLYECPARVEIVLGDARLSMAYAPPGFFDVIVLDAFSSDSIPIHLLTREALALYLAKLAPSGLLVAHISNRYLDLRPVLSDLAHDAGLVGGVRTEDLSAADQLAFGASGSTWAVLARSWKDLSCVAKNHEWKNMLVGKRNPPWTDDYSSIFRCLKIEKPW
ncbi:MAG: fused MFS/spermidine synthase [Desulfomonile tiedjei]|nr:fused MFS/spermidine synthase [Desulfomonile tiedjei]